MTIFFCLVRTRASEVPYVDLVQILQRGTVALRVVKKGVSSHYSLFATLVVIPRRPSTKMKVRRLIPLQMVGYQYCILRLFDVPLQLKTAYCCAIRCIFLAIFTTLATRTSRIIQYVLYRARPFVVTTTVHKQTICVHDGLQRPCQ
jgi:hypothetical protein